MTMVGLLGFCSMVWVSLTASSKVGKVRMRPLMEGKGGPISTLSRDSEKMISSHVNLVLSRVNLIRIGLYYTRYIS